MTRSVRIRVIAVWVGIAALFASFGVAVTDAAASGSPKIFTLPTHTSASAVFGGLLAAGGGYEAFDDFSTYPYKVDYLSPDNSLHSAGVRGDVVSIVGGELAVKTANRIVKLVDLSGGTTQTVTWPTGQFLGQTGTAILLLESGHIVQHALNGTETDLGAVSSNPDPYTAVADAAGVAYQDQSCANIYYFDLTSDTERHVATKAHCSGVLALGPSTLAWSDGGNVFREARAGSTPVEFPGTAAICSVATLDDQTAWATCRGATYASDSENTAAKAPFPAPQVCFPGAWVAADGSTLFNLYDDVASDSGVYTFTSTAVVKIAEMPLAAYEVFGQSVSAGRTTYLDNRTVVSSEWSRNLSTSGTGSESLLVQRATGPAPTSDSWSSAFEPTTASRCPVEHGVLRNKGKVFDPNLPIAQLSGARSLLGQKVTNDVTGGTLTLPSNWLWYQAVLWGPYVVVPKKDDSIVRIDLRASNPIGTARQVRAAGNPAGCSSSPCYPNLAVWGDWVAWSFEGGLTQVRNVVTNDTITVQSGSSGTRPNDVALSDGVLAFRPSSRNSTLKVLDIGTSGATPVTLGASRRALQPSAVDAPWVVWEAANGLGKAAHLPFGGGSAPRLLDGGGVSSFDASTTTWAGFFDATKALSGWTVTITASGSNTVLRTFTGTAPLGQAKLTWNGKNSGGTGLPAGNYNWHFTGTAADGSGAVVGPEGSAGPFTGSITLTRS